MMFITLSSIITALLVVTSTSTVYSVLWLVSTFLIISALLGFLNLGFTALLYIIVYVGAIAILFLFVVQLLDLGSVSEQPTFESSDNKLQLSENTSKGITPLAIVISLALLSILVLAAFSLAQVIDADSSSLSSIQSLFYGGADINLLNTKIEVFNDLLLSTTSSVSSVKGTTPQVQSIAEWFYGPGLLPLVVISIILLVAMIAPISLCKDND